MKLILPVSCLALLLCCNRSEPPPVEKPAILLITLDTTRADGINATNTPYIDALAGEGLRFVNAFATAPVTLPSHISMLTGLYPGEHGLRENARYLSGDLPFLPTLLKSMDYSTAAFVSAYPLAGEFGLARGFDVYNDSFSGDQVERPADVTTRKALDYMAEMTGVPFIWVHYFDPHHPYHPPEPFRSKYASDLYGGELAFMDSQVEILVSAFQKKFQKGKILVVGDHGEGLGEHGEQYHGNLTFNGTVRVPLILHGDGIEASVVEEPVSIRRVFHTIAAWAGNPVGETLETGPRELVMGEAMKPFLQYGWSPQVFVVDGHTKYVQTGTLKAYNLGDEKIPMPESPPHILKALEEYGLPGSEEQGQSLSQEQLERLASLGYSASGGLTSKTGQLPEPQDMTHLFHDLDMASGLFVKGDYKSAIRVFNKIYAQDPNNPTLSLRQAVAHSVLGLEEDALIWFRRAGRLMPGSLDLQHYLGMHFMRFGQQTRAAEHFEKVLQKMPDKVLALRSLATIRQDEGRLSDAANLLTRAAVLQPQDAGLFLKIGELNMALQNSHGAISAFENARHLEGEQFQGYLELGVCYMDVKQFQDAAFALDSLPTAHPGYAMALFKRAQVSVLLREPDASVRIENAWTMGNDRVRELIEKEPLFKGHR